MALTKNYLVYELNEKPMLRLNNLILRKFNFNSGDEIAVTYSDDEITIKKLMKGGTYH